MTRHMILHDDVLGRILTILKQDNYYRTLEELPVIDILTTYKDIQLFPKLYDTTTTIIERVTGEADLIERQLRQPGMYPPLHLKPLYLLLLVLYQNPPQHFNLLHQLPHHQQLTQTRQMDNKVLRCHQEVHYLVDTHRFSQHYQHTISTYTTTVGCASTTCYTTITQFR